MPSIRTVLPFADDSPWRLGVATGCTFASDSDPRNVTMKDVQAPGQVWVNYGTYSHPISYATSKDPIAVVTDTKHSTSAIPAGGSWNERTPTTARISAGYDRHMHVVNLNQGFITEHYNTVRVSNKSYTTTRRHYVDLNGSGIGPMNGCRAYGGSAIGGLIRKWDIQLGVIKHPLAIALRPEQMLYSGKANQVNFSDAYDNSGHGLRQGFVWPAFEQDYNSMTTYKGNIPMGSYFAIPGTVDLTTLGLTTTQGMMVAKAMQDYGVYVTDTTYGCSSLYVEDDADPVTGAFVSGLKKNSAHDVRILICALRLITNNSASTPNGGAIGAARRA